MPGQHGTEAVYNPKDNYLRYFYSAVWNRRICKNRYIVTRQKISRPSDRPRCMRKKPSIRNGGKLVSSNDGYGNIDIPVMGR